MTGSSLVPIIVPVVAAASLAFWLGLVLYAADHPGWKTRRAQLAAGPADTETGAGDRQPIATAEPGPAPASHAAETKRPSHPPQRAA
jgi:hypothetical protein